MSNPRKQSTNQGKTAPKSAPKSEPSLEFQIAEMEFKAAEAKLKFLQLQAAERSAPVQRHAPASTATSRDQQPGKRPQKSDTKECIACKKHFEPEQRHFTKCPQCFDSKNSTRARDATEGKKECKFGDGCTNERCTFAHRNDCRFGSDCNKADCARRHPRSKDEGKKSVDCRYGDGCTKDGCTFSHPAVAAPQIHASNPVSSASSSATSSTLNPTARSFIFKAAQGVLAASSSATSSTLKPAQPQKCKMGGCGSRAENNGYCHTHCWGSDGSQ
jgi:hypothetical protein